MDIHFELNGEAFSPLIAGSLRIPAFSGIAPYRNKPEHQCAPGRGPIPRGMYFVVARPRGGRLGAIRDFVWSERRQWMALYAADKSVDDRMLCEQIVRGSFRLHPKGQLGTSQGCVVIEQQSDYAALRQAILSAPRFCIPGSAFEAYGRLFVR